MYVSAVIEVVQYCQGADPGTAGSGFLCYDYEGRDWMIFCFYQLPHAPHTALGECFCPLHPDPSFLSASRLVHNLVPSLVIKHPVFKSSSSYHPDPWQIPTSLKGGLPTPLQLHHLAAPLTYPVSCLKICSDLSSPKATYNWPPDRFTAWALLVSTCAPTRATMVAYMAAGILSSPSVTHEETLPLHLVNMAAWRSAHNGATGLRWQILIKFS